MAKKKNAVAGVPAQKGTRTKLPADGYWKFRALLNDVNAIEVEATRAAEQFKRRAAEAQQRARELFAQLGKAHGFDPKKHYGWDDATCELIEVATQ